MNKNVAKRIIVIVSVFTLSIVLFCGCASSNRSPKSTLEEQVCTDQLLNYYFEDGTMASSMQH